MGRILDNPAYAGICKGTFSKGANFDNRRSVEVRDAWVAIVPMPVWDAARVRSEEKRWIHRDDIPTQLRKAFEAWGLAEERMLPPNGTLNWSRLNREFPQGYIDALAEAYSAEVSAAFLELIERLSTVLPVSRDADSIVVRNLLRVGVKYSFPRSHLGRLSWEFRFTDADITNDVTIGIGMSPPPAVKAVQLMFFRNGRFSRKVRTFYPTMLAGRVLRRFATTYERLPAQLDRLVYHSQAARKQLLEMVADRPLVNTYALARELGWPEDSAYTLLKALREKSPDLPEPQNKRGHRVLWTCEGCGTSKSLPISYVMSRKSDLCKKCWMVEHTRPEKLTCPECGAVREVTRHDLKHYKNGLETKCAPCSFSGARTAGHQQRRRHEERRVRLKRRLASALICKMRERPEVFPRPKALHDNGAVLISWGTAKRKRFAVRLTDAFVKSVRMDSRSLSRLAEQLLNERRRWRRQVNPSGPYRDYWWVEPIPREHT